MYSKVLSFAIFHRVWIIMILLLTLPALIPLPPAHARPSAFSLISPEEEASVPTKVLLDWEDSADPIYPDGLTYMVILSKDDDSFENPIRITEITNSCHLLQEADGIEDLTTYYWKVQAINEYGDFFETETRYFETANNINPTPAWIGGHVYNSFQNPVSNIILRVLNLWDRNFSFRTDLRGYFLTELDPDEFIESGMKEEITIEISVEGCIPKIISPALEITHGETTQIGNIILDFNGTSDVSEDEDIHLALEFDGKGDINDDDGIDLKDAVLALQILAGIPPSEEIHKEAALGEDEKIDMEELIYILQKIVSPSPCSKKDLS